MFERILFPTDFSEISEDAARQLCRLGEFGATEVVVLHVIDSSVLAPGSTSEWRTSATERSQPFVDMFAGAGLTARTMVESGDPGPTILRVAEEEGATAIALGASGKGHLAELLLGSVSDHVIHKAHLPVLVIKP